MSKQLGYWFFDQGLIVEPGVEASLAVGEVVDLTAEQYFTLYHHIINKGKIT